MKNPLKIGASRNSENHRDSHIWWTKPHFFAYRRALLTNEDGSTLTDEQLEEMWQNFLKGQKENELPE